MKYIQDLIGILTFRSSTIVAAASARRNLVLSPLSAAVVAAVSLHGISVSGVGTLDLVYRDPRAVLLFGPLCAGAGVVQLLLLTTVLWILGCASKSSSPGFGAWWRTLGFVAVPETLFLIPTVCALVCGQRQSPDTYEQLLMVIRPFALLRLPIVAYQLCLIVGIWRSIANKNNETSPTTASTATNEPAAGGPI